MNEYIEFLEGKKFPKKNADRAPDPKAFKDAGYLLREADLVIDIDNIPKPIIEKMISFFNIHTQIVWTDRGAHLYFKKPEGFKGNKIICPLGFEIEYKHTKNTAHVTIKQDGKMRPIENEGKREDLPEIFKNKRNLKSLVGLDEHDGRNSELFSHRMRIHDLSQWKNILRFINNNIFATPLPESEFSEVSRDGVKPRAEKDNQPDLAAFLIEKYKIVIYCGAAYWYNDGSFIDDREVIDRLLVAEIPSVKISFYNEIKQQILMQAPIISKDKTLDIRLENGILRKGKFIEIDFQEFTPYVIKIPFYEEAKPVKIVDEYLDFLSENDQSYKDRLLEILALPLITERDFKSMLAKLAIFVGGGGNGKGTLLQIIKRILGSNNCSNLSIKQMSDERYLSAMIGKLANLGDDLEEEYISKDAIKLLKNISTCDPIEVRRLYELPQRVELTGSLIFTSNHILKAREKGESWKRRVDWIPMYPIPKKKDPDFIKKLTTPAALKYWIRLLVEAYQRLYARREFTYCQKIAEFNENYHMINNNIHEYLEDRIAEDFITRQKRECYREYKAWCEENDEHKLGSENFHDFLCKKFNLKLGRDFIFKNGRRTSKDTYKSL